MAVVGMEVEEVVAAMAGEDMEVVAEVVGTEEVVAATEVCSFTETCDSTVFLFRWW